MESELQKRIKAKSNSDLLDMLIKHPGDYTPEAITWAQQEAERRGGISKLKESLDAEGLRKQAEQEQRRQAYLQQKKANEADRSRLPVARDHQTEPIKNEEGGAPDDSADLPAVFKWLRGSIVLKDESVLNEWAMLVDHAAGHAMYVWKEVQKRLAEARMPDGCSWEMREVRSQGFISRVRREFLVINIESFPDFHQYVGIRDYGVHLDCCRFLTVEPGFLKRWASEKITGIPTALSAPRNILRDQDLRAWATVVHQAVIDSVESLICKLGKDPGLINRGTKGFLEIW